MPSCRLTAGAVAKPRRRKSERSINAFLPRTILCLANRHQDAPDRGRPGRPAQGGWVARWASTRRVGLPVLGPVREGGEQGVRVQGRAPNSSNVPGYLAPAEGECGHLARPGIEAFNGRGQGRLHEFPAAGENLRCCRLRRCVLIGGCHRQVIADRLPCPSRTCPSGGHWRYSELCPGLVGHVAGMMQTDPLEVEAQLVQIRGRLRLVPPKTRECLDQPRPGQRLATRLADGAELRQGLLVRRPGLLVTAGGD